MLLLYEHFESKLLTNVKMFRNWNEKLLSHSAPFGSTKADLFDWVSRYDDNDNDDDVVGKWNEFDRIIDISPVENCRFYYKGLHCGSIIDAHPMAIWIHWLLWASAARCTSGYTMHSNGKQEPPLELELVGIYTLSGRINWRTCAKAYKTWLMILVTTMIATNWYVCIIIR